MNKLIAELAIWLLAINTVALAVIIYLGLEIGVTALRGVILWLIYEVYTLKDQIEK